MEGTRPPAPLLDLFATAVHRFGRAWADLVLVALGALAAATVPILAVHAGGGSTAAAVAVGTLTYAIAWFGLLAHVVLHGLPSRAPARRVAGAYAIAVLAGLLAGGLVVLTGPLALVGLPLLFFAAPAVAAGDQGPARAIPGGAVLALRNFSRTWAVWLLAIAFSLPWWIGVALLVVPLLSGAVQFFATLAIVAPVVWPFSALFVRALYGDLTGRLVVAPEDRTA